MSLLTTSDAVTAACERLSKERFVCVDTEFMRERTYYPKLCLVQISGKTEAVAIDTLAKDIDLSPIFVLMANPEILKVFHACRQDMEIFHHLDGKLPNPIFDTQIGAMVCGHGDSVSYDKLVRKLTGSKIDKSSRFTDWSRRPLSDAQIGYALSDVTHLREAYLKLYQELKKNGREHWLEEEFEVVTNPATYNNDPQSAWSRLKIRGGNPRFLAMARALAAYRETEAQRRDLPRNRILRDDVLLDIAARAPKSPSELAKVRNITPQFASGPGGKEILKTVAQAIALPVSECPVIEQDADRRQPRPAIVELLRVLLKHKAEQYAVAQKLVANANDLDAIALNDGADTPALRGWRREVFGEDALSIKSGRLALSVSGEEIKLIRL